jgi:hypothetical protein
MLLLLNSHVFALVLFYLICEIETVTVVSENISGSEAVFPISTNQTPKKHFILKTYPPLKERY